VPASATSQAYSREDVRRLLDVSDRQLHSWQKQNFVSTCGTFNFSDILALRTLIGLRESKIPTSQIRKAVDAVRRRLKNVHNPLTELKIYSQGKKIRVQFEGRKMESMSGQLLLDFDEAEIKKLLSFPGQSSEQSTAARRAESKREKRSTGLKKGSISNNLARRWKRLSRPTKGLQNSIRHRPAHW